MKDQFYLGLFLTPEREKENAVHYLNKTTLVIYQKLLFELIDCAYGVQNKKQLTKAQLEVFEEGIRQPLEQIFYSYSGKFLAKLAYHFEEAKEIFLRLASDKDSKVRFNIVTSMLSNPPDDVIAYIVEKCVNDPSKKVRKKVPDVCERIGYTKMLGLLVQQYRIEKDESVRQSLIFSIESLKNGYILKKLGEERYNLLVKTGEGITGVVVTKEQLEKEGIDMIVTGIRKNGNIQVKS